MNGAVAEYRTNIAMAEVQSESPVPICPDQVDKLQEFASNLRKIYRAIEILKARSQYQLTFN